MAGVNETLNGILGGQDVMLGILREHGRMLTSHEAKFAEHDGRFDRVDARLELIVDGIQSQP